ncbi:tyrosine-type recombinase/integrase [Haloarcula laminariae]|uniref:tyrosine-type recombinase/integrase n=1 Tax=Haloarcula laminariae TaxID=2961577 RepID=UPI0024069FDB|nr:site-specific integrase [Halomicroarcula sp. FL173]
MYKPDKYENVVLISVPSHEYLNERQVIAYKNHRKKLIKWLKREGKDPESLEGYAHDTARNYATIIDRVHRYVWDHRGGFTLDVTHDDGEEYLKEQKLADEDYSHSHLHNVQLALKCYFRYANGENDEWEPSFKIKSKSTSKKPKDYVTLEERQAIREASLEYGTVPSYDYLSPEKRSEWKTYLARKFGKPKNKVSKADWDRANGFKYPTIVHTSLDAGLRPVEVGRAKTYWVDVENAVLRIPEAESSKNEENWVVPLQQETAEYLGLWLTEREMYDKYDDTDALWLTRHGNPYSGSSLRVLLDNLTEIASIERDMSWYAIRHSVGTYMAREEGLKAAQSQLRHKSVETTMKYDQVSTDDRRDALDNM